MHIGLAILLMLFFISAGVFAALLAMPSVGTARTASMWLVAGSAAAIFAMRMLSGYTDLARTLTVEGIAVALLVAAALAETTGWFGRGARRGYAAAVLVAGIAGVCLMAVRFQMLAGCVGHAENLRSYVAALDSPPGEPLTEDEQREVREHAAEVYARTRGLEGGKLRRVVRMGLGLRM
jgi:hypothetical protein